jgi:hypothetical protein
MLAILNFFFLVLVPFTLVYRILTLVYRIFRCSQEIKSTAFSVLGVAK